MLTTQQENQLTGGQFNPAPLQDIPGVNAAYDELLHRVAMLPFVPSEWLGKVVAERATQSGAGAA